MSKAVDPKGNELKSVLLQITAADAEGPTHLRVRRDSDRIGLDPDDARNNRFLIVWTPEDPTLGEVKLNELYAQFLEVQEASAARTQEKLELDRLIAGVQREMAALRLDNNLKTEELRKLQKERDPDRFARAVETEVAEATEILEDQIKLLTQQLATKDSEIAELRASKKRLKEANERLKEGR